MKKIYAFVVSAFCFMTLSAQKTLVAQSNANFDNHKIHNAPPGFTFTNLEQTIKKACGRYAK